MLVRRIRLGLSHASGGLATGIRYFCGSLPRKNSFRYRKVRPVSEDVVNPLEKPSVIDKGALHVVTVPIGNLKDFTYRAIDVLTNVDYIVTSDRPATKTLLDLVQIPNQGRLIHYNPQQRSSMTVEKIADLMKGGRSMALVTTSGTPCIGDVGAELVRAMLASNVRVTAVPGASAVLAALCCSGETISAYDSVPEAKEGCWRDLADGSFFFGNMLPSSSASRLRILRNLVGPSQYPCVFYEIPRRLLETLEDIAIALPHRRVYVAHELTKLNESLHADHVERLVTFYRRQESNVMLKKGELVLVIAGASQKEVGWWAAGIANQRQRNRMDVVNLLAKTQQECTSETLRKKNDSSSKLEDLSTTKKEKQQAALEKKRRIRRLKRIKRLRAIEREQERLRLAFALNRRDALTDQ